MKRHLLGLSLFILFATGALGAPVARSQEEERGLGIRLTEAPQNRQDDPRARAYIVDHVVPGISFSRRFEIANYTQTALDVRLYAAPASIDDGVFSPGEAGEANELTGWIRIDPTTVQLAPGARATATATVSVPRDAPDTEQYGALFAEATAAPEGGQVAITSRVGIRVYLSVGSGKEPETDFELPAFRPVRQPDGRPAIEIDGCNTGGRAIDLAGNVELSDGPGGIRAGPFPTPNATTLAPDQCHTFTIPLDEKLPLGPWDATAKLRSGKEERTAEATITFPKEAGERGKKVETRQVTGTLPGIIATGISVFLLLLLAGWLFWFLLKRRKRKKDDEEDPPGGSGNAS